MTTQPLTFDVWKARLREDCQRNDKLVAELNTLFEKKENRLADQGPKAN